MPAADAFDPVKAFLDFRQTLQGALSPASDSRIVPTAAPAPVVATGQQGTNPGTLADLVQRGPAPVPTPIPNAVGNGQLMTVGQATGLTPAEAWIITRESGGRTTAKNPTSGAYGFGQLNPSSGTLQSVAKSLGYDPYTTDPTQQLVMFRSYIKGRYGTAENAQRFWQQHGWY